MRTILAQLKQYKKDSILTPLFTALEVSMEVMLPFITALIIDEGIQEGNMRKVYTYGFYQPDIRGYCRKVRGQRILRSGL